MTNFLLVFLSMGFGWFFGYFCRMEQEKKEKKEKTKESVENLKKTFEELEEWSKKYNDQAK